MKTTKASKLDEILDKKFYREDTPIAKQQIIDLMLELIGEDVDITDKVYGELVKAQFNNELRAELRKKVSEL